LRNAGLNDTFNLQRFLCPLAPSLGPKPQIVMSGPRNWWDGALDVEGLALSSVSCFGRALASFLPKGCSNQLKIDSSRIAGSFSSLANLRINDKKTVGFAELSGFFPVQDGWVRLHANYPHHRDALQSAVGERGLEGIKAALQKMPAADVEYLVNSVGGIASAVRKPSEWLQTDNGKSLSSKPWIEFSLDRVKIGPFREKIADAACRPLRGLRILDMTRVIAGPSASRLLGALGADVLRIDPPGMPELLDHHVDTGFDKRSAIADLRDFKTNERVHTLLTEADAVLVGYRLSGLRKLGFDPISLRERHSHLAVVSLDAWGEPASSTLARGFDSIVQAGTGIAYIYGSFDDGEWRPGSLPVQALDHATGMGMAAATLALIAARRKGISGSAHLSLARTAIELLSFHTPPRNAGSALKQVRRRMSSDYGLLEFSPPPITTVQSEIEFSAAPVVYGSSKLEWGKAERISIS